MLQGALIFAGGLLVGLSPLILLCLRALRDDAWDDSNVLNVLRVLAHLAIHPSDFARMHYLDDEDYTQLEMNLLPYPRRAFPYLELDEFESVVETRP